MNKNRNTSLLTFIIAIITFISVAFLIDNIFIVNIIVIIVNDRLRRFFEYDEWGMCAE